MEKTEQPERPWIALNSSYDVEAWIDNYNRDLQRTVEKTNAPGYGICFILSEGGEIYMHTEPEGDVLLDVTPEAEWVAPVIAAATGIEPPSAQIWVVPVHALTQLVLGLSSLIGSSRIVLTHDFKMKKKFY